MAWLDALRQRLGEALRPNRADRDLEDELRDHLDREVARQTREDVPADEAQRQARLRSGNLRSAREAAQDRRTGRIVADAASDLRIGLRGLRRTPGFAAAVIVSLALGVGGTTAMYSIVHAVLVRELPYAASDRLFLTRVWWNEFSATLSVADFLALEQQMAGVGGIGAFYISDEGFTMPAAEGPQVVRGATITAGLPAALGVAPIVGRGFSPDPAAQEVLIGESLWRARFNGSSDAIGRSITFDGEPYTVVGVMPRSFNLPGQRDGAAWIKARFDLPTRRGPFFLAALVRLPEGTSPEAAGTRLTAAVSTILRDKYGVPATWRYGLRPLKTAIVGGIRETLLLLLGAMGLVLLIAVVNVSNLLMARGTARSHEMAIRASLGAGRGRLARQLIAESALLGAIGGGLGVLLASLLVKTAGSVAATMVPRMEEVRVDALAVAFALACGVGAGVLAGLLPSLRLPWRHLLASLREAGRSGSAGPAQGRTRQALVVAEVALTVMIVTGAMLLAKSLLHLEDVDPGFRPDGVLTFRLALPDDPYENAGRLATFLTTLEERLRSIPGVSSVAYAMALPPDLLVMSNNYTVEKERSGSQGPSGVAEWTPVSKDYFSSMGIRIVKGRAFSPDDSSNAPRVAVVNEAFARRHFPDGDAVGRRLKGGDWDASSPWTTIVGVAADVPYGKGLWGGADSTVYVSYPQNLWWRSPYVVLEAAGDLSRLVGPVRQAVAATDPNLPLRDVATMNERLRMSMTEPRVRSWLFALLAGLALTLALTGIYGVMSYHVNQRRRETAIRRALGARVREVVGGVLGSGFALAGAGIVLGTAGAIALSRSFSALLFRVSPYDPVVLVSVAAILGACALVACAVPALRTAGIDPASVLREE